MHLRSQNFRQEKLDRINKGRKKGYRLFGLLMTLAIIMNVLTYLTFREFNAIEVSRSVFRFTITFGLFLAILKGRNWARSFFTVCCVVAIWIAIRMTIRFLTEGYILGSLGPLLLIAIYVYAIRMLYNDLDFEAFYDSQKQTTR